MAEEKRIIGRPFEKGNKLSQGRPKLPAEIRKARTLTQVQFVQLASAHLGKTVAQMEEMASDPQTPALEAIVASIVSKAVREGDPLRLNFLLERIMGKVPNKLEVNTSALTDEELEYKLQEAITFIKSEKSDGTGNSETGSDSN